MFSKCLLILFVVITASYCKRIDIDFENADLKTILDRIARQANLNIICGKDVSGNITIKMDNTPWIEALEMVLKQTGYGYKNFGGIIYVDKPDNLVEEDRGLKGFIVYKIRVLNLDEITQKIGPLLSPKGKIFGDERTGQVIIFDNQEVQQKAKNLIEKLDIPIHQVMVDVRMLNISSALNEDLEQKWNFPLMQIPIIRGNLALIEEPTIVGYIETRIGILPFFDSLLQINLLSEQSKGFEVAAGKLLVQENYQGSINIGTKFGVPARDLAGNTVIQFFSSGFKLTIIPHAIRDKNVKLDLKFEMSSLDRASALLGRPIITTYESEVEICLADGETGIISKRIELGLEKGEKEPCLLRIPIIKYLFNPLTRTKGSIYQYLLITPWIIP